jgi:hypothetical protein
MTELRTAGVIDVNGDDNPWQGKCKIEPIVAGGLTGDLKIWTQFNNERDPAVPVAGMAAPGGVLVVLEPSGRTTTNVYP